MVGLAVRWRRLSGLVGSTVVGVAMSLAMTAGPPASAATTWTAGAALPTTGEAQGFQLSVLSGLSAACSTLIPKVVLLVWGAVPMANSYAILESTVGATSGFTLVATAALASYTTSVLPAGNYWFEITPEITGSAWTGPTSTATVEINISATGCALV